MNPHAGRDVRRLIAPASSLTNHERINVARRVLVGLAAAGIRRVYYMPDQHQLVALAGQSVPEVQLLPALETSTDTPEDTLRATDAMVNAGVKILVTHGGDGTNRLVATRAANVPILPLAAGTNNVFPRTLEATAAGFAAGVLAIRGVMGDCVVRHKRIRVDVDNHVDVALVDAAIVRDETVGSRAVWDPQHVMSCMVTRAAPGAVGLSGLAGALLHIEPTDPFGGWLSMGRGTRVVALIAPGRVATADIAVARQVELGERVEVGPLTGVVALDGERHVPVRGQLVRLCVESDGPWVVDLAASLAWAQSVGAFRVSCPDVSAQ